MDAALRVFENTGRKGLIFRLASAMTGTMGKTEGSGRVMSNQPAARERAHHPACWRPVSGSRRAPAAGRVAWLLGLLLLSGVAAAQPQRESMAVLELEIVGSTKEQGAVLTNQLRAELLKTGRWTMINRAELDKIMKEQAVQLQTCTEPSCAVQLGKLLGVRKIVTGQVTKVTDALWQLSVLLTEVETGEIKRQELVNHSGDFSSLFLSGMANLAQRLSATEQELASGVTRLTPQSIAPKLHDVLRETQSAALAMAPDNARLYYGAGNTVRGWQIPGRAEAGKPVAISKGDVSALAVNRQGTLVAAGGTRGTVTVIDAAAGAALFTAEAHGKEVTTVAFSPTDPLVASGSRDEKVQVTHLRSGERVFVLDDLDDEVRAVRFSPDGRFLYVATLKRSLRVFDVNTRKESRAFRESSSQLVAMEMSPDGALLAVGAKQIDIDLRRNRRLDTEVVKIRNVKTGEELASFEAHEKDIRALAFFPDPRFLASGGKDRQIKLWDLEARTAVASLSVQGAVTAVVVSPNGRWLAGADDSGRITLWEVVK